MKPKPFSPLKNFTVPVVTVSLLILPSRPCDEPSEQATCHGAESWCRYNLDPTPGWDAWLGSPRCAGPSGRLFPDGRLSDGRTAGLDRRHRSSARAPVW